METSISGSSTWRDVRRKSRAARSDGKITAFTRGRWTMGLLSFPVTRVSFRTTFPCAVRVGGLFLCCVNEMTSVYIQESGGDLVLPLQRDVFEIMRDVEACDFDIEGGFQRLAERLAPAFERDLLFRSPRRRRKVARTGRRNTGGSKETGCRSGSPGSRGGSSSGRRRSRCSRRQSVCY